ncbi:MAG: DinB family protein, partial [Actinomycetota bacterium]
DEAGLRRTIASSTMTLAGLLKHMAYVEDHWFSGMLLDLPRMSPWAEVDWAATPDWEWESAAREPATAVRAQWNTSVERSRAVVRDALSRVSDATTTSDATTGDSLGTLAKRSWPHGERPSLRWLLVHLIEAYARHNGHAALLREAVDGETGE